MAVGWGNTDTGSTPDFKQYNVLFELNVGFAKLHTFDDKRKWNPREEKIVMLGASVPLGGLGSMRFAYYRADRSGVRWDPASAEPTTRG